MWTDHYSSLCIWCFVKEDGFVNGGGPIFASHFHATLAKVIYVKRSSIFSGDLSCFWNRFVNNPGKCYVGRWPAGGGRGTGEFFCSTFVLTNKNLSTYVFSLCTVHNGGTVIHYNVMYLCNYSWGFSANSSLDITLLEQKILMNINLLSFAFFKDLTREVGTNLKLILCKCVCYMQTQHWFHPWVRRLFYS